MKTALLTVALFFLAAHPAAAQRRSDLFDPLAREAVDTIPADSMLPANSATAPAASAPVAAVPRAGPEEGTRIFTRAAAGGAGMAVGVGAGLAVGAAFIARNDNDDEWGGFVEAALSIVIGGTVGVVVGAATPGLGAPCTRSSRTLRAPGGTLVGATVGAMTAGPIGFLGGTVVGAAYAADC
ncbi:MAG TPA: hypothetical protein VE913_00045 [Longimicrobium sp.]|nr:hypothetical protein [Longimicrobium sp.]